MLPEASVRLLYRQWINVLHILKEIYMCMLISMEIISLIEHDKRIKDVTIILDRHEEVRDRREENKEE